VDPTVSTARLGAGNSIAGITVALLAPVVGAIADQGTARKKFLIFFAYLGALATAALFMVSRGQWLLAIALYLFASISFNGGNVFYDSLLTLVSSEKRMEMVSSLGYAMGYLGGGILFALNVWMLLRPERFGFARAESAVKFSFLTVAAWWGLFTVPVMLFVKEPGRRKSGTAGEMIRSALSELAGTFSEIRRLRNVFLFLLAYWFYIDGVDTIVRMAVDYGLSLGIGRNDLILALLLTQFVGFPSAVAFGYLGSRISARKGIFTAVGVYFLISVWAAFIEGKEEFYILAVMVGLVQGGIQALSRSFYAVMVPPARAGEYFGFYNTVGKFAAVIGPGLMGAVGLLARRAGVAGDGATRIGIVSISLLFAAGGILFYFVDGEEGRREIARVSAKSKV
jgi:UMF1 family MFS transporter